MDKIDSKKIIKYIDEKKSFNIAITGQNMSGKSKLLLDILKRKKDENIYFISCSNRTINEQRESTISRLDESQLIIKKILEQRIKLLEEGNDKDVLARGNEEFISEFMYELFLYYYDENKEDDKKEIFRKKFNEFMAKFNFSIEITLNERNIKIIKVKKDEEFLSLSTGIKAMIRLFTELWLAKENNVKEVYIDEVDMHIDQKNSLLFLNSLYEIFNQIRIITVIHNMSIISGVKDTLIISLYGDEPKIFHSNEYLDIRAIANDIYEIHSFEKDKETETEKRISDLLEKIYNNEDILNSDMKEEIIEEFKELSAYPNLSFKAKDNLEIIGEIIKYVSKNSN